MKEYRIEHYLPVGAQQDIYTRWLSRLRDDRAKVAIIRRVYRMAQGNFGDHRFCRDGVWELRIDIGAGYRVYYALSGQCLVLLLGGGSKRTQNTDIEYAASCWKDWQQRTDI